MSLRLNLDVATREDCDKGIEALGLIRPLLPTEEDWYNFDKFEKTLATTISGDMKTCVCGLANVEADDLPTNITQGVTPVISVPPPLPVNEARAAEQVLMTEAVQSTRRRGRPRKNTDNQTVVQVVHAVQEELAERFEVDESDNTDLMDLITQTETSWVTPQEPVEEPVIEDDLMSMLGEPVKRVEEPIVVSGDRYDAMDHEALYQEVRKRSGDDIRAPAIGTIRREVMQRDKKIDSIYKFTDSMLRNFLRIADTGLMKDISDPTADGVLIAAWKETL